MEGYHQIKCESVKKNIFSLCKGVRSAFQASTVTKGLLHDKQSMTHSQRQMMAALSMFTIRNTSSSSGTGSRSGTVKDSGNCAPLVKASAALMVVEKHSNQAHSFGFHRAGSGRQC